MNQTNLLLELNENSSLTQIQDYIKKIVEMRGFADQPVQEAMLLLLEETGELAKAVRKAATRMAVDADKSENYGAVESEAADVFIVLTSVCNLLNINLYTALMEKEKENCERRWSFAK